MAPLALNIIFSIAVLLTLLPSGGLAGPACAQKYWGTQECISICATKWGYPGHKMGNDRWGSVMKESAEVWEAVLKSGCGLASSSDSSPLAGGVANDPPDAATSSVEASILRSTSARSSLSATIPSSSTAPTTSSSSTRSSAKFTTSRRTTSTRKEEPTTTPEPEPEPKPTTSTKKPPATTKEEEEPAPTSGGGGSGGTSASDIAAYLKGHNDVRANHGAKALTWSDNLAASAQKWANGCLFEHSGGSLGPFGENLAAGTGSSYGISTAIKSWTDEVDEYNPSNPKSSHFTQVVWKATTQVGCALQNCDGIFDAKFGKAKYYVCEYSRQGNVVGQFDDNVEV